MSIENLSIGKSKSVNDLSKYVIGAEINRQEEDSGIIAGAGLMGGISGSIWAVNNRHDLKGGIKKLGENAKVQKNIVKSGKNYWAGATEYTSKTELENLANKLKGKKYNKPEYNQLRNAVNNALSKGKNFSKSLKDVEKLQAIQKLKNYNAKVAKQIANGSVIRKAKNATGITKLSKATKELAVKSGKFRGLLKGLKGNAGFAAISFGIGLIADVIPAFSLGTDKGLKQLGKTTVKTGAEVAGWAAGSAIGAKAGAAIGSFLGPIGTVVGGAIGLVGGFAGSYIASKLADKVVGPNETEIAEKEMATQIAKEATSDAEVLNELALATYEQLLENAKNGTYSENDENAKKALENLLGYEIDIQQGLLAKNDTNETNPNSEVAENVETKDTSENTNTNTKARENKKEEKITKQIEFQPLAMNSFMPTFSMPNIQPYNMMNPYMMNPYMTANMFNPFNTMPTNTTKFVYVG